MGPADDRRARIDATARALALTCILLLLWFACRPYAGIDHDARLYALMGLARLEPDSLGGDLILRHGGQDAYTLFGPLVAALLQRLGLETTGLLLTLVAQAWWFGAAWLLLRRLLPGTREAFVALAVLVAVPLDYGAAGVFEAAESFMTPRPLAEAASLTALWLALERRWLAAGSLLLLALLLHPLMAAPAALVLAAFALGRRGPWLVAGTCLAGVLLAVALARVAPVGSIAVMDPDWLALVQQRVWFANVSSWDWRAWAAMAAALAVLWLVRPLLPDARVQRLVTAVTVVALTGLVVDAVGGGWGKVILVLQGQGARWSWPAVVLAHALAVQLALVAWRRGVAGQAALLWALAALFIDFAPQVAVMGIAAATWLGRDRLPAGFVRGWRVAGAAALLLALYPWLATRLVGGTANAAATPLLAVGAAWLRWALPAALLALAAWTVVQRLPRPALAAGVAALATLLLAPAAVAGWRVGAYGGEQRARFAAWRAAIPAQAEVHWPGQVAATWFLLERRSWVSSAQTAGILFSREAAFEALARAEAVRLVTPPQAIFSRSRTFFAFGLTADSLRASCRRGPDFLVGGERLDAPLAAAPARLDGPGSGADAGRWYYLYDCRALRAQAPGR